MQVKKIIAVLLAVCLLFSLSVPAYAVDEVYSLSVDTAVLTAPIFYTPDYYPGAVAEMRSSGFFANRIAHGSYSALNYNPSYAYVQGNVKTGDFNSVEPFVTADQTDVSGIYQIPNTTLLEGSGLFFKLPSTDDCYFDFQSSNFLFDQQSPQANTFYINGDLTFSLRNLWDFNGYYMTGSAKTVSWYLASDPLAVQLVIDGKAYGDIIDVTSYTSPFTALYNGGVPSNATVSFNNLKVYYQGDTPDMIGFRVYTGSAFTPGSYTYGDFRTLEVTNTITFRCSEIPDITFVQEGGDGYAGDLSGIQGILNSILSSLRSFFTLVQGTHYVGPDGSIVAATSDLPIVRFINYGFQGLRSLMVDSSGQSWFSLLYSSIREFGVTFVTDNGSAVAPGMWTDLYDITRLGFLGLRSLMVDSSGRSYLDRLYSTQTDLINGVSWNKRIFDSLMQDFSWQSYNMQSHQLNSPVTLEDSNSLFLTAFQSIEDKLGRLAYVFGSDEDLALKDSADPGTDAFRESFGGGLSIGQISDGKDVVEGVSGLLDSGYSFGDAFAEIANEDGFLLWFSAETAAALDSTGSVMALDDSDPYNMQIYYDHIQTVKEKREAGDD